MIGTRPWQVGPQQATADAAAVRRWVQGHREGAGSAPIWSANAPGELLAQLPRTCPPVITDIAGVLGELEQFVVPGLVRWDAPGWFAFFPSNAHPHALLGDQLGAALSQQGMLWMSSPACTELEIRVLEWLRQSIGLPECYAEGGPGGAVMQDTASSAVLSCLVAARDRATDGLSREQGLHAAGPLTVYASDQAHSSVLKAVQLAGLGRAHFRAVPVDKAFRMDAAALERMITADIAAGLTPCFCVATVGTTGCGAVDPVEAIAGVCAAHNVWLHVDAAWAGTAALHSAFRPAIVAGADSADSWCFNPHKWMGVNFDCSCLWLKDRTPLIAAMRVTPEYLRNPASEAGDVVDYRDWHVQLGRRFRALKLWMLLRCTGVEALAAMVAHHVELACWFEQQVEDEAGLMLAAPRSLGLVCMRHVDGDEATQRLIDAVNASGQLAVTHCRLDGHLAMRVAIGTLDVEQAQLQQLLRVIQGAA